MLDSVYSAAVINDILEREKRKGQRNITDPVLLKKIILFLADNIGNNTSATSIGNTLVNEGLLENGTRKTKPAVQTIQAYIEALTEAYIFYEIKRFDIKGKEYSASPLCKLCTAWTSPSALLPDRRCCTSGLRHLLLLTRNNHDGEII